MIVRFDKSRNHALAFALMLLAVPAVGFAATESAAPENQCEYGITLAMSGNLARAESVFVSLIAPGPGSARALNNLGNLQLLRGDVDVALAFYERALRGDSTDAGIRLNRAVALMMLGRDDEARAEAEQGVSQAGGMGQAASLLGLKASDSTAAVTRAAEKSFVNREEVRALLSSALQSVPRDSSRGEARARRDTVRARRTGPAWRSGGPRAAEGSDADMVLYWKR
jgi:tetratricopeptide (TPR) repeat protein